MKVIAVRVALLFFSILGMVIPLYSTNPVNGLELYGPLPRNEPPTATGENLTGIWVYEGESKMIVDMDDHELFTDPDNDTLIYLAIVNLSSTTFKDRSEFLVVWNSPSNQLFVIQNQNTNGTGNVSVRLYCSDKSEFNLAIDPFVDFIIEVRNVNDLPAWTGYVPSNLFVMEGSNRTLLDPDIDQLFIDDEGDDLRYMPVADLSSPEYSESAGFRISWLQAMKMLEVGLNESSDWFGTVSVRFYCTDQMVFDFDRDAFVDITIEVRNVNDPPKRTKNMPYDLYVEEGEPITLFDHYVDELFYDPDGDTLDYLPVAVHSFPEYNESAEFSVRWDRSSQSIEVKLNESSDWFGEVPVILYCTDQKSFNFTRDPYVDLIIRVVNVDDPPMWKKIPKITVYEDTPSENILDLSNYVIDIDTPFTDLEFRVESYSNRSFINVLQERNNLQCLSFGPRIENWYGSSVVNISVEEYKFTIYTNFLLEILPVNDKPLIKINDPKESDKVQGDVFSITGDAYDVEGIEKVEINFMDEWKTALGKEDWGLTYLVPEVSRITESVPIVVKVTDTAGEVSYDYVNITILPPPPEPNDDYDGDGVPNDLDAYPFDPTSWESDLDRDGVPDKDDAFPTDPREWKDTDKDGRGDNSDMFPRDPTEWADRDGDGIGDNSDDFPDDPAASLDSDGDCFPDEWNPGRTEKDSTTGLRLDAYPHDHYRWDAPEEKRSGPLSLIIEIGIVLFVILVFAGLTIGVLVLLRSKGMDPFEMVLGPKSAPVTKPPSMVNDQEEK